MKKEIKITIQVKSGSKFQEMTMEQSLQIMLQAWQSFYQARHKENKIDYKLTITKK